MISRKPAHPPNRAATPQHSYPELRSARVRFAPNFVETSSLDLRFARLLLLRIYKPIPILLQVDLPLLRIPRHTRTIHRHRQLLQFPVPPPSHPPVDRQFPIQPIQQNHPALLIPQNRIHPIRYPIRPPCFNSSKYPANKALDNFRRQRRPHPSQITEPPELLLPPANAPPDQQHQ